MKKKAIIFDLDNTIFPVHSIGEKLFAPVFQLIHDSGEYEGGFDAIKDAIMRKPFQVVASAYQFSDELTQKCLELLTTLAYKQEIEPFADYLETRNIAIDKYLVTTGFPMMQQSKIDRMNLANDFREIHIVDPATSTRTKKDVFADILYRHHYSKTEVLVVGDDLHSEIKAAAELGIDAVVYDKFNFHKTPIELPYFFETSTLSKISDYKELAAFL